MFSLIHMPSSFLPPFFPPVVLLVLVTLAVLVPIVSSVVVVLPWRDSGIVQGDEMTGRISFRIQTYDE